MEHIDWLPDRANSVSSSTGRLIMEAERAVEVRADASSKAQIAALLDLLDLHLSQVDAGGQVHADRVTLRVPNLSPEARGAIGTLIDALRGPTQVRVLESGVKNEWTSAKTGWDLTDLTEYSRWPELLARPRLVPALVADIVRAVGHPALRAYPMLSSKNDWSLRFEGLEVAQSNENRVTIKVGRDGKFGGQSLQREVWVKATGHTAPLITTDVELVASTLSAFARAWQALGETNRDQDEHALESRILRGATPISIQDKQLSLLATDAVVNWGSQFPTKWGPGGKARYLDALLRDGSTPWAIEMKIQGGTGVGQYYRHAVAQAVLYREFIRQAVPLHPWFNPDPPAAVGSVSVA